MCKDIYLTFIVVGIIPIVNYIFLALLANVQLQQYNPRLLRLLWEFEVRQYIYICVNSS